MTKQERIIGAIVDGLFLLIIVKTGIEKTIQWENLGLILTVGIFWAPHAYFRNQNKKNYHSISYNKKKIESLTTSINMLSLKLKEVEKTSQAVAKAQGFSNLNRKFTL